MSSGLVLEAEGGRWKQYPAYRDSGVGWLGAVPENWQVERLRFHISINPTKSEVRRLAPDTTVSFIPMEAVGEYGGICLDQTRPIEDVSAGYTYFQEGDVVVAKITPCFENVKRAVVTGLTNGIGFGTTELHVLRPNYNINRYFLFYLTLSYDFRKLGESEMYGSAGQKRVPEEFIKNLKHPIPSLSEQHAIAAFLDRETGRIDALIAKKERQIELLQEKRTALISHAVTKGLDPDAPMKDSGVEWLGEVPEHWESVRLKWVAKMESGHTPNKKIPEYWANCDIPWVSLNDTAYLRVHDYIEDTNYNINELGLANSSARLLPSRAVVFTRDATIGLSAITTRPMAVSQHIIAWLCGPRIVPEYLLRVFYAMAQEFERLTMGSTIKTIGMPDVDELKTPVPPLGEQIAIVKYVLGNTDRIDMVLVAVLDSINLLREYRRSLISAAVTGKIDVRGEET